MHTITGGWGDDIPLPLCVGHEVIGKVVKVGDKVTKFKVGDRAGVGAQIGADLTCNNCKADQENYCPNSVDTYGAKHTDGTVAQVVTLATFVRTSTSPSRFQTTSRRL